MDRKLIISEQPNCKTCGNKMLEWNAFAEVHEHIECSAERISASLFEILKKQFEAVVN
jgi:hypothetical protein